jgi:alpha-mannosidase
MRLTESGPVRTTVKTTYVNGESRVSLYYTFYNDADYIDVNYEIDWHKPHTVLKFVTLSDGKLTVSSPFFSEERGETEKENPMSQWLTTRENGAGKAVITDSVFAYSHRDGKLELSVLRSCIYGDLRIAELDENIEYPFMEQGILNGRLRMVFYDGNRNFDAMATAFNNAPIVICEANHTGVYAPQGSFMSNETDGVSLSAWKMSIDGSGEIIRLCENAGAEKQAVINRFGKEYSVTLAPYEIKTLKLVNGELHEVWITEDEI